MSKPAFDSRWIDRYLRNELSEAETESFETALLESSELQDELETAIALQQALMHDSEPVPEQISTEPGPLEARGNWQPLAMAASLVLAVSSTVLFWKAHNETQNLQHQLEELGRPVSGIVRAPIDIMRSSGQDVPDVIIQKPGPGKLLEFDIQLSPSLAGEESLIMRLLDSEGSEQLSWPIDTDGSGRVSVILRPAMLPDGLSRLEMSDTQGQFSDTRLLEFRPARP